MCNVYGECLLIELYTENIDVKKEQQAAISFCVRLKNQPTEDVWVITAGIWYAMFVKTYGKKTAQTVFRGLYEGGSGASWFGKKNSG